MRQPNRLRFGPFELVLQRRELTLDGKAQAIAPKAYDLLVLLVQHRDRAVPRHELSAALWPGKVLSESVLARTVMKARRALGDMAAESQWIRSVHGFGYRFVGEVSSASGTTTTLARSDRARTALRPALRIGILPCVNATGETRLEWVQFGLMSLVVHALAQDQRLVSLPVTEMSEPLPPLLTGLSQLQARRTLETLDLDRLVHATLCREGPSMRLDYRIFDRRAEVLSGHLGHSDPLVLGEQLAKALCAAAFPGERAPSRFVSRDPFVNQLFSRAVELFRQEDGAAAAPLFALVCNMEPDEIGALQWHVRCRAVMKDPAAVPLAETLLARAATLGDTRARAMGHAFMVFALGSRLGDEAQLRRQTHVDAAFKLAEGHEHEDWFGMLLFHVGMQAALCGHTAQALQLCKRAEAVCRGSGNVHQLSIVQQNLALIEIGAGDLASARERLGIVLRSHRSLHRTKSAAHALGWLAMANAGLGLLDVAFGQCDEMLSLLGCLQHPGWECAALAAAVFVYSERMAAVKIERVLAAFEGIADKTHPLVHGPWLAAQSGLALSRGDAATARALLHSAIQTARPVLGAPFVRVCATVLMRQAVAAGDFAEVDQLLHLFAAHASGTSAPEVHAVMLHAQAAVQMHQGNASGASRLLVEIIEQAPSGREHAFARFDAAWLHLEQGQVEQAARLIDGLHVWCQEHPVGLATHARLQFASDQHEAAATTQDLALRRHLGPVPAWHHAARRVYAAAAAGSPAPLPPLPGLVSDSWR